MTVSVSAATDLGLRRSQNEDSHAYWHADDLDGRGVLLVVADGMGGARAGEVASHVAIETVMQSYREAAGESVEGDLVRAVEAANQAVHRQSLAHPEMRGMGTTCTAVVLRAGQAYYAHVGDSRAYLLRDGGIRQLTQDHSLVAQLVQSQQITAEQARTDPRRNLVTRSVGVADTVAVDAGRLEERLRPGDRLLLCTDGLHGVASDQELAELGSGDDLDRSCRELIELANQRGGPDNITVILARIEETGE